MIDRTKIDFEQLNKELVSKPLYMHNASFMHSESAAIFENIELIKDSIKNNGKNSVEYDFSHFGSGHDSELKFL